jgi:hypothetical protein
MPRTSVQGKARVVLFAVLHLLGFHPEVGRDARFHRALRVFDVLRVNQEDDTDFEGFHGQRQKLLASTVLG